MNFVRTLNKDLTQKDGLSRRNIKRLFWKDDSNTEMFENLEIDEDFQVTAIIYGRYEETSSKSNVTDAKKNNNTYVSFYCASQTSRPFHGDVKQVGE